MFLELGWRTGTGKWGLEESSSVWTLNSPGIVAAVMMECDRVPGNHFFLDFEGVDGAV